MKHEKYQDIRETSTMTLPIQATVLHSTNCFITLAGLI